MQTSTPNDNIPAIDKIVESLTALEFANERRKAYLQAKAQLLQREPEHQAYLSAQAQFLLAEREYHAAVGYCRVIVQEATEHEAVAA